MSDSIHDNNDQKAVPDNLIIEAECVVGLIEEIQANQRRDAKNITPSNIISGASREKEINQRNIDEFACEPRPIKRGNFTVLSELQQQPPDITWQLQREEYARKIRKVSTMTENEEDFQKQAQAEQEKKLKQIEEAELDFKNHQLKLRELSKKGMSLNALEKNSTACREIFAKQESYSSFVESMGGVIDDGLRKTCEK